MKIISMPNNKKYDENYPRIFGKKEEEEEEITEVDEQREQAAAQGLRTNGEEL
jgi:hypothetical protein